MKRIARSKSMGALSRRFARDMEFQHEAYASGPGATHAGPNAELALRFGTYQPMVRPAEFSFGRFRLAVDRFAAKWAELSDVDASWFVLSSFVAVGRK